MGRPRRAVLDRLAGGVEVMWRLWLLFLATFRLSLSAVCEMSRGRGHHDDFHDWPDSTVAAPLHMHVHTCKRCGKEFEI